MAAIDDLDDLASLMTGGGAGDPENLYVYKNMDHGVIAATVPTWSDNLSSATGAWKDWWNFRGIPNQGVTPASPTVPTSATQGAIPFTNAVGGREKFVVQAGGFANRNPSTTASLYDRLWHCYVDGNVTTSQDLSGTALTRHTDGVGNEIWVGNHHDSAGAISAAKLAVTYTNQAGTGSRVTQEYEIGNFVNSISTMWKMPLQAGDTGVQSVESIDLVTSVGAGDELFVVVAHPHLIFGNGGKSLTEPPWPKIEDDACLALAGPAWVTGPMSFVISTVER